MTRLCWWLVDRVSRVLEPDEREAVQGDLAESSETGGQALRDILGLIVRRQIELWKDWRSWLVLVGLIVPLTWLLSLASRFTSNISSVYIWSYVNNWDWTLLQYGSFWYVLRDAAAAVFLQYAILVCWSWSAGFLLGSISGRLLSVNSVLFCLLSVIGQILGVPRYLAYLFQSVVPHRVPSDPNGPIFALGFYRETFPVIVQTILVAVPAVWAMRRGASARKLPTLVSLSLWIAATLTVIAMAIQEPGLRFFLRHYRQLAIWHGWLTRLLQLVVYWPIGYLVLSPLERQWHGRVRPIFNEPRWRKGNST